MLNKLILAVALLFPALRAQAVENPFCIGLPISNITDSLKPHPDFTLLKYGAQKCGGGVDEQGNRIAQWDCFLQLWGFKGQNADKHETLFVYERNPETQKWVLVAMSFDGQLVQLKVCEKSFANQDHGLPSGQAQEDAQGNVHRSM